MKSCDTCYFYVGYAGQGPKHICNRPNNVKLMDGAQTNCEYHFPAELAKIMKPLVSEIERIYDIIVRWLIKLSEQNPEARQHIEKLMKEMEDKNDETSR